MRRSAADATPDGVAGTAGTGWVRGVGLRPVVLWASAFPEIRVAAPELGVVGLSLVRPPPSVAGVMKARLPAVRDLPLVQAGADVRPRPSDMPS